MALLMCEKFRGCLTGMERIERSLSAVHEGNLSQIELLINRFRPKAFEACRLGPLAKCY